VLVPLGAASVTFAAGVNSSLQLAAGDALRGRVMALYSVVFLGSTPIGAPITGALAETAGPRAGLLLGGIAALGTAIWGWLALRPTLDPSVRHGSHARFSSSVRARRELGSVESPQLAARPRHSRRPQKEQHHRCPPPRSPSSA
jgi:MFS family permease